MDHSVEKSLAGVLDTFLKNLKEMGMDFTLRNRHMQKQGWRKLIGYLSAATGILLIALICFLTPLTLAFLAIQVKLTVGLRLRKILFKCPRYSY